MMISPFERTEELLVEYAGQEVRVEGDRANLARFKGKVGHVTAINQNGCALVQFEGPDRARYDIGLDYVRVIDTPREENFSQPESANQEELSALELARMVKP
jgi:hypothetical protein